MKQRKIYSAVLGLALLGCTVIDHKRDEHSERIIGRWRWSEVERGVVFTAHFLEGHKLMDIYEAPSGYTRERAKEWRIQGDTLILTDGMGADSMLIRSIGDSIMELERVGDHWPLVFYRE